MEKLTVKQQILDLIERKTRIKDNLNGGQDIEEFSLTDKTIRRLVNTGMFGDKKVVTIEFPAFMINKINGNKINFATTDDSIENTKSLTSELYRVDLSNITDIKETFNSVEISGSIIYLYTIVDKVEYGVDNSDYLYFRMASYTPEDEIPNINTNSNDEDLVNYTLTRNPKDFNGQSTIRECFSNGLLKREFQINLIGKRNGLYKSYFENGQIEIECLYIDEKIHGVYKEYYENGQIYIDSIYVDGKICDIKKYNENGELFSDVKEAKKQAITFTINPYIYEKFKKVAGKFAINKSKFVENAMVDLIEKMDI